MNVNDLPKEIVAIILIFRNDPITCSFVCKLWQDIYVKDTPFSVRKKRRLEKYGQRIIKDGSDNVIDWAGSMGYNFTVQHSYVAAQLCDADTMRILKKYGCEFDEWTLVYAVDGDIELSKWLVAEGCKLCTGTYSRAVSSGSMEMVSWLHEIGCPCDDIAWANACANDDVEMLKYLQSVDCPKHEHAELEATLHGSVNALDYISTYKSCNMRDICTCAAHHGNLNVLEWVNKNSDHLSNPINLAKVVSAVRRNGYDGMVRWLLINVRVHEFKPAQND